MKQYLFIILASSLLSVYSSNLFAQEPESLTFVPRDKIEEYWLPENIVPPRFPRLSSRIPPKACVAVMFIIESDGTTSNHRPVAAFPSAQFNQSALTAAKQFTYTPAEKNQKREPVFTTHSFTFQITSGGKTPGRKPKGAFEEQQLKLAKMCTTSAEKLIKGDLPSSNSG